MYINKNYFDDSYSFSGVGVANLVMGNNCKLNPTAGNAMINELEINDNDSSSWFSLGSVVLDFDSTCDGQAHLRFGIGSYGPITDERVPLRFNE